MRKVNPNTNPNPHPNYIDLCLFLVLPHVIMVVPSNPVPLYPLISHSYPTFTLLPFLPLYPLIFPSYPTFTPLPLDPILPSHLHFLLLFNPLYPPLLPFTPSIQGSPLSSQTTLARKPQPFLVCRVLHFWETEPVVMQRNRVTYPLASLEMYPWCQIWMMPSL